MERCDTVENNMDIKYQINISDVCAEGWFGKKNYKLERLYLTTFSFDMQQFNNIIFRDLKLEDDLINDGKLEVFFDKTAVVKSNGEGQMISGKYLHGIHLREDNKSYAFHPKVMLMKYKIEGVSQNEEKDIAQSGYEIIVLSKNISQSEFIDVYAVAHGKVKEKRQNGEKVNGEQVSEFFRKIFEYVEKPVNCEKEKILAELAKTNFVNAETGKKVDFWTTDTVYEEIKQAEELIVISPFLSEKFVEDNKDKIACIVSNSSTLSEIGLNRNSKLKEKCRILDKNIGQLHAKIYCCKKGDKVIWVIGSSNATNNGCNICKTSQNIEFNIGFEGAEEEFNEFERFLLEDSNSFEKFNEEQDVNQKDKENYRKYYSDFVDSVNIKAYKEAEGYCVDFSLEGTQTDYKVLIGGKEGKENDLNEYKWSLKGMDPILWVNIKIIKTGKGEAEFGYSLYNKWGKNYREKIDEICEKNRRDYSKKIDDECRKELRRMIDGKKIQQQSQEKNVENENGIAKSENLKYVFEEIAEIFQREETGKVREVLKKIKNKVEEIKDRNKYEKDWLEMLNKILEK